jgi:hypothetical protein
MQQDGHRSNRGKTGESADMTRRYDDTREQHGAEGIAGKIRRHHEADRLAGKVFITRAYDQQRSQKPVAEHQQADAGKQRGHRRNGEANSLHEVRRGFRTCTLPIREALARLVLPPLRNVTISSRPSVLASSSGAETPCRDRNAPDADFRRDRQPVMA